MAITINWNDPNSNAYVPEETVIYRSTSPFNADDLPEPLAVIVGAARTYTDESAIDHVTYYYRVAFKIGDAQAVSRLFEITGPTQGVESVFYLIEGFGVGEETPIIAATSKPQGFTYPEFVNTWAKTFVVPGSNTREAMPAMVWRIAAMIAILTFKRDDWETQGIVKLAPLVAWPGVTPTSSTTSRINHFSSNIEVDSKLTYRQAFDIIAAGCTTQDIAIQVIGSMTDQIESYLRSYDSWTSTLNREMVASNMWFQYITERYSIFDVYANTIVAGHFRYSVDDEINAALLRVSGTVDAVTAQVKNPSRFLRFFTQVFSEYPEIKQACRLKDGSTTLNYLDAADNVVDYFNNSRQKVDPGQCLSVRNNRDSYNAALIMRRASGLMGILPLPTDQTIITQAGDAVPATNQYPTERGGVNYFEADTANGKKFACMIHGLATTDRSLMQSAQAWQQVSGLSPIYTEGMTDVDPLESQVLMRILPHLGLENQATRPDKSLVSTNSSVVDPAATFASRLRGDNICNGFPEAGWNCGAPSENPELSAAIISGIDIAALVRANTPFTIELFMSYFNDTAVSASENNYVDLISTGNIASGTRMTSVYERMLTMISLRTFTSPTNTGLYRDRGFAEGRGVINNDFNPMRGGSKRFKHVVMQWSPDKGILLFNNGVLVDGLAFGTIPTAATVMTLMGSVQSPANTSAIQHYAGTFAGGYHNARTILHEAVVTLGERYLTQSFVGKVPFARKRFPLI